VTKPGAARYTHVATNVLRAVTSPVDRLISPGSPPEKPPAWPPSAADPNHLGARIAITSVLHTWGSAMTHHPHVHMIVPGGGLSMAGERWIASKPNFFLPVLVLEALPPRDLEKLAAAHTASKLGFFGAHAYLADNIRRHSPLSWCRCDPTAPPRGAIAAVAPEGRVDLASAFSGAGAPHPALPGNKPSR
jgi:hypothetical protein